MFSLQCSTVLTIVPFVVLQGKSEDVRLSRGWMLHFGTSVSRFCVRGTIRLYSSAACLSQRTKLLLSKTSRGTLKSKDSLEEEPRSDFAEM